MAILFQNTLLYSTEYLKISTRYSSPQSLSRAKKKGSIALSTIGGMVFVPATAEQVRQAYSIPGWEKLTVIEADKLPGGLAPLNRISKSIGLGEASIIEWGMFDRLDVYWVGGRFFANPQLAGQVAASAKK